MQDVGDNISVIIRCHNEERWIGHSIQSVLDIFPNSEIIVVDNDSTDDSLDIVRMFEKWNNIKMISISDYSPGRSLNMGVKESSNNYSLILSAHCRLNKFNINLIEKLDKYVAIFGKQIPFYRGKRINTRYIWSHFINTEVENMWSNIENRYFLHNALCLYKKDFLLEFPFDETLYGKEDRYWAKDIVEKGFSFLYTPNLESDHYWTPNGATWKGIG